MLRRLSRSLSFRLFVIFVVLGSAFVFGTFKAIQRFYNSDQIRGLISGHLSLHVSYVREDIGVPPSIDRAIAITEKVPVDIRILGPDLDWASDPDFPRLEQLVFAPSPRFSGDSDAWADELQDVDFASLDKHDFLRMRQGGYDIVVSTPRISDRSSGPALVPLVLGLGLFLLILAYAAVTWLFKPIRAIRQGAEHIGRGNFDFRIAQVRADQLGDLAEDINRMAGDVESMLDAKRALLLGISHELRTPLSRMRLELEFFDDGENVASLKAEIGEMEKIVVTLLEAERLNSRHAQLSRTHVVIDELVRELLDDFFSRDIDRIEVMYPIRPVSVSVDEARISLLLKNLLANAIQAIEGEGTIRIETSVDSEYVYVKISDTGKGILPENMDQIFDPGFTTRGSGVGTGLGLSTSYNIVQKHEGEIEVESEVGKGSTFTVRIPMVYRES